MTQNFEIAVFNGDGIGPEIGDFCFVWVPCLGCVGDTLGKHLAKDRMAANAFVEQGYNPLYICAGDVKTWWECIRQKRKPRSCRWVTRSEN